MRLIRPPYTEEDLWQKSLKRWNEFLKVNQGFVEFYHKDLSAYKQTERWGSLYILRASIKLERIPYVAS